jgi:hypothetical protein
MQVWAVKWLLDNDTLKLNGEFLPLALLPKRHTSNIKIKYYFGSFGD